MTATKPRPPRSRLLPADVLRGGTLGLRYRRGRALLSALGIAIGIASLVAVLGITRSSQSALLAEIDQLGTNLLTVTNGQTLGGQEAELPVTATAMIRNVAGVQQAAPTAIITSARVYRTGKIPVYATGGLAARAADPSLLTVLGGTLSQAREGGGIHLMATSIQEGDDLLPAPPSMPSAMHQHKCGHARLLFH